jgi:hypothetical protein
VGRDRPRARRLPMPVTRPQWHIAALALAYRCGGSVGLGRTRGGRTDFPFNLAGLRHQTREAPEVEGREGYSAPKGPSTRPADDSCRAPATTPWPYQSRWVRRGLRRWLDAGAQPTGYPYTLPPCLAVPQPSPLERCRSGRSGLTRNQVYVYAYRGFESHPLRQLIRIDKHSGAFVVSTRQTTRHL